jgi:hypothetical protein
MRPLLLLAALFTLPLASTGCTFVPGTGFATVTGASLAASFQPGARGSASEGVLTDLGYAVTINSFSLELGDADLLELQGGAGGAFDPADPPAGYGLCHNGHCHAEDGRLVSYAEIEAELAGDSAEFVPIVSLLGDQAFDLLVGTTIESAVSPSSELPLADMSQLELGTTRLLLEGTVTGGPEGGELAAPISLLVDLELDTPFAAGIDLVVDRDSEPEIVLTVQLTVDGTLFDELDFATVSGGADLGLTDPTDPASISLVESLLANLPALLVAADPS